MIRILFLIPTLSGGGAEKVLRTMVNNMDPAQFDITVQTVEAYAPGSYLNSGIRYKAINRCKTALGRKLFRLFLRLCAEYGLAYSLFIKDDYDIEVAYLETEATKLLAQSTNKRAVKLAWVHCDLSHREGIVKKREKMEKQYRRFDQVICVSKDVEKGFQKLFGKDFPTRVLHNVIDEEEIFAKAEAFPASWERPGVTQLLAVGRLSQEKNYPALFSCCARLKRSGVPFHLTVLGDGPERKNLEDMIRQQGLDEEITLRGFESNPYPWIKGCDLMVCSSLYEGLSTVVQEAMILGKAIVTTPVGGMHELLGDSEYGLIASDWEAGLLSALEQMIRDPNLRRSYAERAGRHMAEFDKAHTIRLLSEFFREMCPEKK